MRWVPAVLQAAGLHGFCCWLDQRMDGGAARAGGHLSSGSPHRMLLTAAFLTGSDSSC